MNYKSFLDKTAQQFETYIHVVPENTNIIPTEDYGWYNARYESELFRLAHVERYSDNKIEVLHVTTFPHRWSPEPIFGFDVICTDNKIVGAYMDLSPGLVTYDFDDGMDFKHRKPLPEWATVFSDKFILLSPESDEEFEKFVNWTLCKYMWYLMQLENMVLGIEADIVEKQNTYCEVQASNPRTYNVLKHKIGEEKATHFMEHILFPKIL
jgi:hypothetical protein